MTTEAELKMDDLLRREAGEDWHDRGLSGEVLRAIVRRELAADRVAALSGLDKFHSDEMKDYLHKSQEVTNLKQDYGISDPPPRLPAEDK